jgi:hypothetical protein
MSAHACRLAAVCASGRHRSTRPPGERGSSRILPRHGLGNHAVRTIDELKAMVRVPLRSNLAYWEERASRR